MHIDKARCFKFISTIFAYKMVEFCHFSVVRLTLKSPVYLVNLYVGRCQQIEAEPISHPIYLDSSRVIILSIFSLKDLSVRDAKYIAK